MKYPAQPRRGLSIGDCVKVDHTRMNERLILPEDRDFYGDAIGEIVKFLDDAKTANNGAALVRITPRHGMEIRPYIDTCDLVKHG